MRMAMATSSVAPGSRGGHDGARDRTDLVPVGTRIKDQLLCTQKRRAGSSTVVDGHHLEHAKSQCRPSVGTLLGLTHSLPISHLAASVTIRRGRSLGSGLFRRYDSFPKSRYQIVQPFREDEPTKQGCPHLANGAFSGSSARQALEAMTFVAYDALERRYVLVTIVPKASASVWQIDHVQRVMLTLTRCAGFQQLLDVWEMDSVDGQGVPPSWVFVQDFKLSWIPLDLYCDAKDFTEHTLRHVAFDIVSMVYFLHAHQLSASGQMCGNQDFMVDVDTHKVIWLLSPSLVLSGCLLAHATSGRLSRDITSIGYLMFHLAMVPHAATLLRADSDADGFEKVIQENLSHLTMPCRAMMLACLIETPKIEELVKRKWLRQVEFVSFTPRLDHHPLGHINNRRLMLHTLLWKLASFLVVDWIGNMHALGATPSASAAASAHDEEEVESTRRGRKAPAKRQYVGRHVSVIAHHYNHHRHGGVGGRAGSVGGNMIMRGMVIVPPLGSVILPHSDDDLELKYDSGELSKIQPRSFVLRDIESTLVPEDAILEVSAQATKDHRTPFDAFGFEFPTSPLPPPVYDTFEDPDDDVFAVEISTYEEELIEDMEGRRRRVGSLLVHENGRNHSMHSIASISDLRNVMRSLNPSNRSDEREELHQFDSAIQARAFSKDGLDPVHLSAFGPSDISLREKFRIDIWAYLRQQRKEMLETALELNDSEVGQRVQPMHIARGTLITVSIEASDQFSVIGEDCKSFRWRGEVNGVSFDLQHQNCQSMTPENEDQEALCIARVVAGTKVSLLFIRLRALDPNNGDSSSPAPLPTRLEHLAADVPDIPAHHLVPLRPIGKGAFGEAMLAVWKERDMKVVIKTPHRDAFQADTESLEDFRHEAAVMQMLGKHPHVVELFGVTTSSTVASDDISAIVTEYLPNGSLHDFLTSSGASHPPKKSHVSDSTSALSLFSRTVMARDAAHGIVNIHQGHVLHRDIAARNCLLDENFRVKVCDFGMSRLSSKKSCLFFDDEHHGFGPIKWMAPESVLPPHLFSTHSDSYMFGVLMYEIFSGQLPFPGISSRDAMGLILEGQHVPIPDYLPHAHQQLMKRCFDPHPLSRPSIDLIFTTLDQWILHDTRHQSQAPVGIL